MLGGHGNAGGWDAFWVFLHVASVLAFTLAHGTPVAVALKLRRERDRTRIRALVKLSAESVGFIHLTLLAVVATGVVLGFTQRRWDEGWIWASLALVIGLWVAMSLWGTRYYDRVRVALGIEPFYGSEPGADLPPEASDEELDALLSTGRPWVLAGMGVAVLLAILWLMVVQPF